MDFLTLAQMREAVGSLKIARTEEQFYERCCAIVTGRAVAECHWHYAFLYYGNPFTVH